MLADDILRKGIGKGGLECGGQTDRAFGVWRANRQGFWSVEGRQAGLLECEGQTGLLECEGQTDRAFGVWRADRQGFGNVDGTQTYRAWTVEGTQTDRAWNVKGTQKTGLGM